MDAEFQDRNLLVAVIALQMDYISQPQLVEAMKDWVFDKSQTMEGILEQREFLEPAHAKFLKAIVLQHLNVHKNNVAQSLAALSGLSSTRKHLDGIDDALDATLQAVSQNRSAQFNAAADSISFDTFESDLSFSKRFRILRSHAKGGLGEVSIANDTELNRQVAVKQIQQPFDGQTESRHRFLAEAEITGKLEHPGIVPVYSLGCDDEGRPFYAMRFIRGDSLKEALHDLHHKTKNHDIEFDQFRMRQLVGRLVDVCNAIHYAHSRGILHRDLKPGNIMLGRYGETLVVDWGLAKPIGKSKLDPDQIDPLAEETLVPRSGEGSTETRMGSVVGTLAYMSPEQADGRIDSLGPWSDVYGLGATLFSILTGKQPIKKADQSNMLRDISRGNIVPIKQHSRTQDPAIEAICKKAMALSINDRYKSAGELAHDLERWIAGEPVDAFPEPWQRRTFRWIQKHRTFCTTAVSLITLSAIGLSVALSLLSSKNRQLENKQQQLVDSQDELQGFSADMLQSIELLAVAEETNPSTRAMLMQQIYEALKPSRRRAGRPKFQVAFSDAARSKARMSVTVGAVNDGLQQYDEAINTLYQLSKSEDKVTADQAIRKIIEACGEKAGACRRNNQFQEVERLSNQANELLPQLLNDQTTATEFDKQMLLGRTKLDRADVCRDHQNWATMQELALEARQHLALAQDIHREEKRTEGIHPEIYGQLAAERAIIAHTKNQKFEAARKLAQQEVKKLRSLLESKGFDLNRRYALGLLLNAQTQIDLAENSVTLNSIERQLEAIREMKTRYLISESGGLAQKLCDLKHTLAMCYSSTEQVDKAKEILTEAIALLTPHTVKETAPADFILTLAECYRTRNMLSEPQDLDMAMKLAQRVALLAEGLPFYTDLADELKRLP